MKENYLIESNTEKSVTKVNSQCAIMDYHCQFVAKDIYEDKLMIISKMAGGRPL